MQIIGAVAGVSWNTNRRVLLLATSQIFNALLVGTRLIGPNPIRYISRRERPEELTSTCSLLILHLFVTTLEQEYTLNRPYPCEPNTISRLYGV